MPRRSFRSRSRAPKRKLTWEWAGMFVNGTILVDQVVATWIRVPAGYVDNANSAGIPIQMPPDYTLVRSRILASLATNNGSAQATYPFICCQGIIAWDGTTDDVNDIGVIPSPYWDQELDWVWRNDIPLTVQNTALFSNTADLDAYQSKAMRKLSNGTGLLYCFTLADPLGSMSGLAIALAMNARCLYKLP